MSHFKNNIYRVVIKLGISQKKFITHFTKPEEIMAKRRPDKKLDFQGKSLPYGRRLYATPI